MPDVTPFAIAQLDELQRQAIARHPELEQGRAKIAARDSGVTLARKAYYPEFELGVGYNSLWDDADKRPTLSLSFNLPLDFGKRRAELAKARAEQRQARWDHTDQQARLLAELAAARARTVEMVATIELHETELVPLSEDFLDAAMADYRSGRGSFLAVIAAEQRSLDTALSLARAQADYLRRVAELERWAGVPVVPAQFSETGENP